MCGIGGAFGTKELIRDFYNESMWLHHRGEESVGIAFPEHGRIKRHVYMGNAEEAFHRRLGYINTESDRGILHLRYSTAGASTKINIQPVVKGKLAVAHQGNLANSDMLREKYGKKFRLETQLDSEAIACIFSDSENMVEGAHRVAEECMGAYELAVVNSEGDMAFFRGPHAFHPLYAGRRGDVLYAATEDSTLQSVGCLPDFQKRCKGNEISGIDEIRPGELIHVSKDGEVERIKIAEGKVSRCFVDPIYFMLHSSTHKGRLNADIRYELGWMMGEKYDIKGDIIVPVLDSGRRYDDGLSKKTGIPTYEALVRNRYIGRTFIQPEGKGESVPPAIRMDRMHLSKLKNMPIVQKVRGKDVILTDDTIIRRNVMTAAAQSLFEAGMNTLTVVVGSPPIRYGCVDGMDYPDRKKLAASKYKTVEEANAGIAQQIAKWANVDGSRVRVFYPEIDDIKVHLNDEDDHCFACLTGEYRHGIPDCERLSKAWEL